MGRKDAEDAINGVVAKGDMFCRAAVPVHRTVGRCLTLHGGGGFHGPDVKTKISDGTAVVPRTGTDVGEYCRRRQSEEADQ